uniref:Uncharacterized protein n=1 Tax=Marinomonas sp. (strain MWYL1) TaxID=400668 RepID=A6W0B5_MARMS
MELYRFGGETKTWDFGYSIPKIESNRYGVGLVDSYALDRLTKLVVGGLKSFEDLYAAEMAIRALVFHDQIQEVYPSIKVQVINNGGSPFVMNLSQDAENRNTILDVLKASNHSVMLCGVDQMISFSSDVDVDKYLHAHEEERQRIIAKDDAFHRRIGEFPVIEFNPSKSPIEFVANDKDVFFSDEFMSSEKHIGIFLRPLSCSGYAIYLGNPILRNKYESLRYGENYSASEFFSILDSNWNEYQNRLRRRIKIPIPLFLNIVLSRASSREMIPQVINALKAEFSYARKELWSCFDEADFRIYDSPSAARELEYIEKQAASIIPKALKAREYWFPIRFDAIGKILEFKGLDLIKDIGAFVAQDASNSFFRLDAANLTIIELSNSLELNELLESKISPQEISSIQKSILR